MLGAADVFSLPIEEAFDRVHASNMTKTFARDATGKILKGPAYVPPDIAGLFT